MNSIIKFTCATLIAGVFAAAFMTDADAAKRLGGGKSTGMQRDSVQRDAGTAPKAAPAPTQAAPATAGAAAAPAASGASRWLGPLAGLAAGGLLASMFMGGGFSGLKLMDILLFAGVAIAGFMVFKAIMRKKAMETGTAQGAGTQYSGSLGQYQPSPSAAVEHSSATGRVVAPEIGSRLASGNASIAEVEAATANPRIPADFDTAPFEREARTAFMRLQAANDRKDLDDIRDFSTPEMYAELAVQLQERGDVAQRTEVVSLAVNVLEVSTENNRAIASVRYIGTIREATDALPETFDEVWHVVKNVSNPKSTWQLAGIQQLA